MKELGITTGVAAALLAGACSQGQPDNGWTADKDTAICVDQQGHRVPDGQCPQQRVASAGGGIGASPFLWYYLGRASAVPYYGDRVSGGSYAPAAGRSYFRAPAATAMTRSAAISRGGFGSSARSFGGGRS